MDATQKQRIRKTAKIHFAMSVFLGLAFLIVAPSMATTKSHSMPDPILIGSFFSLVFAFMVLQPQFFLLPILIVALTKKYFPIDNLLGVILVPFWSYAFSWILIHSKDWLNHFPVLGKRVF